MPPALFFPEISIYYKQRLSKICYSGYKNISRLPKRSAIIAFSQIDVYEIANKIKQSHGGVSVVLGALTPDVRNAQVKLFEEGKELIKPDIIIIDGGRGQYNIAKEVLLQKNIKDITLLSISKGKDRNSGREIIHISDKNINLKPDNPLLYFIQRVRDEAHRFAITAHRSRKRKNTLKSIFDDIPGIGPKRKKELIIHFGSLNKIKNASLSEIKSVKNITEKIANKIYDFFNSH